MDLALTGGTIYDPATGKKGKFDVGFKNGRIAAVQEQINPDVARETHDVSGKTVVPGLIVWSVDKASAVKFIKPPLFILVP